MQSGKMCLCLQQTLYLNPASVCCMLVDFYVVCAEHFVLLLRLSGLCVSF